MQFNFIAKFVKRLEANTEEIHSLQYVFHVMLWKDFQKGTIAGFKYNRETVFFNSIFDNTFFGIWAYCIGNTENYKKSEVQKIKFHYLNQVQQDFLNSLAENDIITFKVNIPLVQDTDGIHLIKHLGFKAWDFEKMLPMARIRFDRVMKTLNKKEQDTNKTRKWIEEWINSSESA